MTCKGTLEDNKESATSDNLTSLLMEVRMRRLILLTNCDRIMLNKITQSKGCKKKEDQQ